MLLANVDFELAYWRARRRVQRMRQALRYRASQARMHWKLWRLRRRSIAAEQEPEDGVLFRCLFVLCLVGGPVVLLADALADQGSILSAFKAGVIFSMWG